MHRSNVLPALPGVGYKPQHFSDLMTDPTPVGWLEIHAENYMSEGGRPMAQLRALAERFPISVHGVGLSIGGEGPLDHDHLSRLRRLCDDINPASFSEHLAWSSHGGAYFNDLLPLPYTQSTLTRVVDHIDQLQDALGRQMLLENPSSYLAFEESDISEPDFLREVSQRTGCGLLLDVNNVFVSAVNLKFTPEDYIDAYDLSKVREIHVAGHDVDEDGNGNPLLIDSHGAPTAEPVWALLDYVFERGGERPVLIEWDNDVPEWPLLAEEARIGAKALERAKRKTPAIPERVPA